MYVWVGTKAVKAALNVRHDANFFSGDNGIGFNYTQTEPSLLSFYQEMMANTSLRVMII